MYQLGFLGFGNMAKAIAGGVIGSGFLSAGEVTAYDPDDGAYRGFVHQIRRCREPGELAANTGCLFLSVKPQTMREALAAIKNEIRGDMTLVSIAAGIPAESIAEQTGRRCPVVRAMPNAPMMLGKGTTAIARPDGISDDCYSFVCSVFGRVGTVYEIPKDKFNEVIPVHGSSPAFIYLFAKTVAAAAEAAGLDYKDAVSMFSDTLAGCAEMIQKTGRTLDELIEMVSSKGGTTVAALDAMRESGFTESIQQGFARCVERARELGA